MLRSWFRKFLIISAMVALVTMLFPNVVMAQGGEESLPDFAMAINTMWVLICGFLVFFMQAGFGFLEAGFIRSKNVGNILMENFIDTAITGLTFFAVGFALMFGVSNGFNGTSYFFLNGIPETIAGIPTLAFFFFQFAFSAAASTIASGAMSERTEFKSDLVYSVVVSALIYPIVGHWIWGGGWLGNLGFADFAGSTVVHSVGAWAGLMGTLFLGPRLGKSFKDNTGIPGHSMALAALGTFILWLGWFGFNPGSTISGMAVNDISLITVNTNLAACAGIFVAVFIGWWQSGVPQLPWAFNGGLAGLVAITAACAWVTPAESILIGAVGGAVMYLGVVLLERFKIDDPVGAVGVHGFGGVWGTLAVGLFANSGDLVGLFHGGGLSLLGIQIVGIVSVFLFVSVTAAVLFAVLKAALGLRVSPQAEMFGLDLYEHGLLTYPEFTHGFSAPSEPTPGNPHHVESEITSEAVPAIGD